MSPPLLGQQAERLKFALNLNRKMRGVAVQQSKPRSCTSYGRILFKASAITLFGRIHVDNRIRLSRKSVISRDSGNWPVSPNCRFNNAARTTTGTGISYMQMELAHSVMGC